MVRLQGTTREIINELLRLDMDTVYKVEITEPKSKRSLEQNRMLWAMVHDIAKKTGQTDNEIYCAALERADALSDFIATAKDMEEDLKKCFRGVRFIRKAEINGKEMYVYKVYLGSSKMTTAEMSELNSVLLDICEKLGLDEWRYMA